MRILVEPSAHHLQNMGDVAMLTVTVRRLRGLWPDASIGVIAEDAERLARHCPDVTWIPAAGRRLWLDRPMVSSRLHSSLPTPLARRLRAAERLTRLSVPRGAEALVKTRRRLKGESIRELDEFLRWAPHADVIAVVGAGLLTDEFAAAAVTVLELLESAVRRGAVTVMMGQGIGPVSDPELAGSMARVLPRLDLVCLREERGGRPILRALGIPESHVLTTGDDAIELAYEARPAERRGVGLGVSLRVARYSAVTDRQLAAVGDVLRRLSRAHGVPVVPIPISSYWNERDAHVIAAALKGATEPAVAVETPLTVIELLQRCRVVVTGSYHAAVFALAQGIPAVGLAGSPYYIAKFEGLADQFDGHCSVVMLQDSTLPKQLAWAVEDAWGAADELAPMLVAAAERQLRSASSAMARLCAAVTS